MNLELQNPELLRLEPYLVATRDNRLRFDLAPFGLTLRPEHCIDPLRMASAPFLELLKRIDEVTFGPEGMPMPRWVFFDGAELPGGIVGFGLPVEALPEDGRRLLSVPADYRGLVPLSMFIAIPTFEPGVWMAHNLASVASVLPQASLRGLGAFTKAVGLKTFRARSQVGATQWNSFALRVHTRLGPLALLTAWTPAHSEPWTLTYRVELTEARLRHLARDASGRVPRPRIEAWLDSDDHAYMQRLQADIERGSPVWVAGPPKSLSAHRLHVPLCFEIPCDHPSGA